MLIKLTPPEIMTASHIAAMRRVQNIKQGTPGKYGAPEKDGAWEVDIWGCFGEMAVAKYFNLYWAGNVGDKKAIDVGGKFQVRTARRSSDCLLLHPDDDDSLPFVLVIIEALPFADLRGWILAKDGKIAEFWKEKIVGRPCYFVPQSALIPIAQEKIEAAE
jgi:hypothetical protein